MGALAERAGDLAAAIGDLEASRAADPGDATVFGALDRLLAGEPERREALWANQAARTRDPAVRASTFVRAAEIARVSTGASLEPSATCARPPPVHPGTSTSSGVSPGSSSDLPPRPRRWT